MCSWRGGQIATGAIPAEDQDEIIPYQMGRDLADALPEARFVSVPGGHHGDLFQLRQGWLVDEITAFGART